MKIDVSIEIWFRNTQDIRRMSQRQQNLEDGFGELGLLYPEEQASSGSLRITPKTPIFGGKFPPVKFLEELKDFWAAVRPTRLQAAFVISSCLQGTPKDWCDLVKE